MGVRGAYSRWEALWAEVVASQMIRGMLVCPAGSAVVGSSSVLLSPSLSGKALATSDGDNTPACVDPPFTFQVREWAADLGLQPNFTWPEGVNGEPVP